MSNPTLVPSPVTASAFSPPNWGADVCSQLKALLSTNQQLNTFFSWLLDPTTEYLSDEATLPLQQKLANVFGFATTTSGSLTAGYDSYAVTLPYYPFSTLQPGLFVLQVNIANGDGPANLVVTWTPPTGTPTTADPVQIVVRGTALVANQLQANGWYLFVYDGNYFQLLNPGSATPVFSEEKLSPLFGVTHNSPSNPVYSFAHGMSGKAKQYELIAIAQNVVGPINVNDELGIEAFFYQDGSVDDYGLCFSIQNTTTNVIVRAVGAGGNLGWVVNIDKGGPSGGSNESRWYTFNDADWQFQIRCRR